ncbi:hypothetical protein ABEB36_005426 [Hypothenemus hampei]|uniref:Uncharacterized protein n=1 Tax=Hypothenemus hampei TaxID=57062 RepID=A0ABD1F0T3_HYPHA
MNGFIVVLRKGKKSSAPYELEVGEHTIGAGPNSNVRLRIANPLLLETHAILRIIKSGVAIIVNKSKHAPIRINNKVCSKSAILKDGDVFQVLDKEFQYFNEALKTTSEDNEIFCEARNLLETPSRETLAPIIKTPTRTASTLRKETLSKTPSYFPSTRDSKTPSVASKNSEVLKTNTSIRTPNTINNKSLPKTSSRQLNTNSRTPLATTSVTPRKIIINNNKRLKMATPATGSQEIINCSPVHEFEENIENLLVENCTSLQSIVPSEANPIEEIENVDLHLLQESSDCLSIGNSSNISSEISIVNNKETSSFSSSTEVSKQKEIKHPDDESEANSYISFRISSVSELDTTNISENEIPATQYDNESKYVFNEDHSEIIDLNEEKYTVPCDNKEQKDVIEFDSSINEKQSEEELLKNVSDTSLNNINNVSCLSNNELSTVDKSVAIDKIEETLNKSHIEILIDDNSSGSSKDCPGVPINIFDELTDEQFSSEQILSSPKLSPVTAVDINTENNDEELLNEIKKSFLSSEASNASQEMKSIIKENLQQEKSVDDINIFDESTQEAHYNIVNVIRTSRENSIFDQSTESISNDEDGLTLSPVKAASSSEGVQRQISLKNLSKDSSLTDTYLNQSSTRAVSISTQSFSSFKRDSPNASHNDSEIDVVNFTGITGSNTPIAKRDTKANSCSTEASTPLKNMRFEEVSCSSTPFPNAKLFRAPSSNGSIKESPKCIKQESFRSRITAPTRRSIRNSVSKIGDHGSRSSNFTAVKRGRSLSLPVNKSQSQTESISKQSAKENLLIHKVSIVESLVDKTPEKNTTLEDETPKSHVKPTRRLSRANQSLYNPEFEDITPVTPEKLQVSGLTEQSFKTPVNTPGLFESLRKSAVRSKKRQRESQGSVLKITKKPRVEISGEELLFDEDEASQGHLEEELLEKSENSLNLSGVGVLHHGSDVENTEDLFTQLSGKQPMKAYISRGKSLSPYKTECEPREEQNRRTVGDVPHCSPRVQDWINEQQAIKAKSDSKTKICEEDGSDLSKNSTEAEFSKVQSSHESLFENISEHPQRKPKRGRSFINKNESILPPNNRRRTYGKTTITPDITSWKQERAPQNTSAVTVLQNNSEEASMQEMQIQDSPFNETEKLKNIPEKRTRRSRRGRSQSIEKQIKLNNRKRTHGINAQTPDANLLKQPKDTQNTSVGKIVQNNSKKPSRQSRKSKSQSPERNIKQNNHSKTSYESAAKTPDLDSWKQKKGVQNISIDDIIQDISEEPSRKSKRGKSQSPEKTIKQSSRRKTYGTVAKTPDVDSWKQQKDAQNTSIDDIIQDISEKPTHKSRRGKSQSPEKNIKQSNRRKTYGSVTTTPDVGSGKQEKKKLMDDTAQATSGRPSRKSKRGKSLSADKNIKQSNRRKTYGNVTTTPDVYPRKQEKDGQNILMDDIVQAISERPSRKSKRSKSLSLDKNIKQNNRRKTYGSAITIPNVDSMKQEKDVQNILIDDIVQTISERPNRKSKRSKSFSPEKNIKQTNRRKTYGNVAKTPDVDLWKQQKDAQNTSLDDIIQDISEKSTRKSRRGKSQSPEKNIKQSTRRKTYGSVITTPDVGLRKQEKDLLMDDTVQAISGRPSRKFKRGKSLSVDKNIKQSNRRKTYGSTITIPDVDSMKQEKDVQNILIDDIVQAISERPSHKTKRSKSLSLDKNIKQNNRRKTYGSAITIPDDDSRKQEKDSQNILMDDIVQTISERPSRRSKRGKSQSPEKTIKQSNRRKTYGTVAKTPDVDSWKQQKDAENTSIDDIIQDIPEKPTRKSRRGKSQSPDRTIKQSNRRKSYGSITKTPDVNSWKQHKDAQNTSIDDIVQDISDEPSRKSKRGKSRSPEKIIKQSNRKKTYGTVAKTPEVDSRKQEKDAQNTSVDEVLQNISEQSSPKYTRNTSLSPQKQMIGMKNKNKFRRNLGKGSPNLEVNSNSKLQEENDKIETNNSAIINSESVNKTKQTNELSLVSRKDPRIPRSSLKLREENQEKNTPLLITATREVAEFSESIQNTENLLVPINKPLQAVKRSTRRRILSHEDLDFAINDTSLSDNNLSPGVVTKSRSRNVNKRNVAIKDDVQEIPKTFEAVTKTTKKGRKLQKIKEPSESVAVDTTESTGRKTRGRARIVSIETSTSTIEEIEVTSSSKSRLRSRKRKQDEMNMEMVQCSPIKVTHINSQSSPVRSNTRRGKKNTEITYDEKNVKEFQVIISKLKEIPTLTPNEMMYSPLTSVSATSPNKRTNRRNKNTTIKSSDSATPVRKNNRRGNKIALEEQSEESPIKTRGGRKKKNIEENLEESPFLIQHKLRQRNKKNEMDMETQKSSESPQGKVKAGRTKKQKNSENPKAETSNSREELITNQQDDSKPIVEENNEKPESVELPFSPQKQLLRRRKDVQTSDSPQAKKRGGTSRTRNEAKKEKTELTLVKSRTRRGKKRISEPEEELTHSEQIVVSTPVEENTKEVEEISSSSPPKNLRRGKRKINMNQEIVQATNSPQTKTRSTRKKLEEHVTSVITDIIKEGEQDEIKEQESSAKEKEQLSKGRGKRKLAIDKSTLNNEDEIPKSKISSRTRAKKTIKEPIPLAEVGVKLTRKRQKVVSIEDAVIEDSDENDSNAPKRRVHFDMNIRSKVMTPAVVRARFKGVKNK